MYLLCSCITNSISLLPAQLFAYAKAVQITAKWFFAKQTSVPPTWVMLLPKKVAAPRGKLIRAL